MVPTRRIARRPGSTGVQTQPDGEYSVTLNANREGYRENLGDLDKPGATVFLGDSFVWGTGVEEPERFSNVVGRKTGLDVLNYGACTAGTLNELSIFLKFVRDKKPSRVFLVFYPNDVQNNLWWLGQIGQQNVEDPQAIYGAVQARARLPSTWPDEKSIVGSSYKPSALLHFYRKKTAAIRSKRTETEKAEIRIADGRVLEIDRIILNGDHYTSFALTRQIPVIDIGWRLTQTTIKLLKANCDAIEAPLTLVYLPYMRAVQPDLGEERGRIFRETAPAELMDFNLPAIECRNIAQALGIDFVDLTPDLAEAYRTSGKRMYHLVDGHLTVEGNRVVAETLLKYLAEKQAPPVAQAGSD